MLRATLKSLAAHKLRMAMTALAIVLGVGFVAGTYVLTDTMNAVFDDLFTTTTQGVDVDVRTRAQFEDTSGAGIDVREPVPEALATRIQRVDGVEAVQGDVSGYAQIVRKDGEPVATTGAPTLGQSFGPVAELNGGASARAGGRLPAAPDEAVIDARTADKYGFRVGDRVRILFEGPSRTFTLVGVVSFGNVDNLGGATLAGFQLETAQEVLNRQGSYDSINVVAADGVASDELRDRIQAALGQRYEALTGQQLADETADSVQEGLGFFTTAMLTFAAVALFVGTFLIYNTFSIVIAQRTRELALLRCMGASRRQVLTSVLTESVVVALLASVVGIGFGILLALGLRSLFGAIGIDLPQGSIQLLPRTIIASLVVGLLVTLIASLLPAVKATRVPPVAALREEAVGERTTVRPGRIIAGGLITVIGVVALLMGLFADVGNELAVVGAGAALTLLGVGVLSPLIARPLARAIGWPIARLLQLPAKLARANAMRNPRRTAATAAALMIGLALVAFVSILGTSLKASTDQVFDEAVAADYQISSSSFGPFSADLARRLQGLPELSAVTSVRMGPFRLDGQSRSLMAVDGAAIDQLVDLDVQSGSMRDLASGGVAVYKDVAADRGWRVGSTVPMELPRVGVRDVPVKAVFADKTVLTTDYVLALSDFQQVYPNQQDFFVVAKAAPGVAPEVSRAAVERVAADFPNVQVQDQAEYKESVSGQVDQLLTMIYVLLALAILIAVIGIVNTLALSIHERIRELGLLRAVGMDRRQVRAMIRWEAVIMAVAGALLGLVIGTFFGWAVVRALEDIGTTVFQVPALQLTLFVVLAAIAGVLAAVLPGRRAARVDVLRALAAE
jgi:putative ABC transport system permease protein